MAAAAQHARRAPAPTREQDARTQAPAYAYRAPHTRRKAAQRSRFMRAFVVFVGCLTVLAVGRVALSFAVVQKTLQTDAIVREERQRERRERAAAGEGRAAGRRPPRIRHIAETQLGLVDADARARILRRSRGGDPSPRSRRTADGGSARQDVVARPAGAAAASSGAPRPRGAASTAASGSSASSSSSFSCSSAARPSRSPRRRSTSPQIALDQQTAERRPAGAPRLDPRPQRRRAGRGQAAADGLRDPYLLKDPKAAADELCDALQINRRRERRDAGEGAGDREGAEEWFAYVARKVDPEYAKAALALDLPGVGSYAEEKRMYPLKGSAAQVLGFAGIENTGLAGDRAAVRQGALRQGRQRDDRARPGRPRAQDDRPAGSPSPARTCASRSTATSSTTPRTSSRRPCATPAPSPPSPS